MGLDCSLCAAGMCTAGGGTSTGKVTKIAGITGTSEARRGRTMASSSNLEVSSSRLHSSPMVGLRQEIGDRGDGMKKYAVILVVVLTAVVLIAGCGSSVVAPNMIGMYKGTANVLYLQEGGSFRMDSIPTTVSEAPKSTAGTYKVVGNSVILYDGSGKETGVNFKIEGTNLRGSDGTLYVKG